MFRWTGGSSATLGRRLPKKITTNTMLHPKETTKIPYSLSHSIDSITGSINAKASKRIYANHATKKTADEKQKLNIKKEDVEQITKNIEMICENEGEGREDEEFKLTTLGTSFVAESECKEIIHVQRKKKSVEKQKQRQSKELTTEMRTVFDLNPDRKNVETQC